MTLSHDVPLRNAELFRIREVNIGAARVSNLQRAVGADELVVDLVDSERRKRVAWKAGYAGASVNGGVVNCGWETGGAVGGGEEGDVDLRTGLARCEGSGGGEREDGEGGGEDS